MTAADTTPYFDLGAMRRALKARDAAALAAMYTEDAEMTMVDRNHPPSRPQRVRGREEISAMLEDICADY
jgi:ketosteroid isomerase-like protein